MARLPLFFTSDWIVAQRTRLGCASCCGVQLEERKVLVALPRLEHGSRSPHLALLQCRRVLPLRHVRRIHVPARLDAESRPLPPCGDAVYLRHIDPFTRVELEGRLGAVHLKVQRCVRVRERRELPQRAGTRIERDLARVGFDDEAVVKIRFRAAQDQRLVDLDVREGVDVPEGDGCLVEWQVFIRVEARDCALDGRASREIVVANHHPLSQDAP